jgi:hypothetical protein
MWKLPATTRIAQWRDFRKTLATMGLEQAVEEINHFWTGCPFTPYYLEADQPQTWPDPWTLISENYYCDLAKCLGIVYTVLLGGHKMDPEIHIYQDTETRLMYHLAVLCQGKYVINLHSDEVVNITSLSKTLQLKYRYTEADLKLQ